MKIKILIVGAVALIGIVYVNQEESRLVSHDEVRLVQNTVQTSPGDTLPEPPIPSSSSARQAAIQTSRFKGDTQSGKPYAQTISEVLQTQDSSRAMFAVQKLEWCSSIDQHVEGAYSRRDNATNGKTKAAFSAIASQLQDEQRKCQGITPELAAGKAQLLTLANFAKAPGAGVMYLNLFQGEGPRDEAAWKMAIQNTVTDGLNGDRPSILQLAANGDRLGIPVESRWAFAIAALSIHRMETSGNPAIDDMMSEGISHWTIPANTPQETVERVNAEANRVISAYQSQRVKHRAGG